MRTPTAIAVLLALLLLAVPAAAQQVNAPPGNAGVDEYLETVPGAGGNRPSDAGADRSPLTPGARSELERQGADGRAAAELAEREGPAADKGSAKPAPVQSLPQDDADDGLLGALGSAATGSDDGMGIWLPLLLVLSAVAALAAVVFQRRRMQQ